MKRPQSKLTGLKNLIYFVEWYPSEGYHSRYSLDILSIFPRYNPDKVPITITFVDFDFFICTI